MTRRTAPVAPVDESTRILDGGFWLVLVLALACGALLLVSFVSGLGGGTGAPAAADEDALSPSAEASIAAIDPAVFLADTPEDAPPIDLTAADGRRFSLASLRGSPTFVFFGYTHCTDVCPATIGTVGEVLAETQDVDARALFVTIDPERDTPAWLTEYARYMPSGFVPLTGTPDEIATTAKAWDVQYAKVDEGDPTNYSMSHTATVRLVDAAGLVRATFPFGATRDQMAAALRDVVADPVTDQGTASGPTPATAAPASSAAAAASAAPAAQVPLTVQVTSTSVWAGPPSPIILSLSRDGAPVIDPSLHPTVQLRSAAGDPVGAPVTAVPVQPPGEDVVRYVASPKIPAPGPWRIDVSYPLPGTTAVGSADIAALDPGATPPIGGPAPTVHTPTLTDVAGVAKAVTTDPAPDLRLSSTSTSDALAAGRPFVLVVDSTKFRVSPACGRAIVMARFLLDRWPDVAFIHLEPYRYSIVTDTPVLDGSLEDPTLTDVAAAWGVGSQPWGVRSMPWTFVVDGRGIVRAAYQGVMGTDDVDVIVSMIQAGG